MTQASRPTQALLCADETAWDCWVRCSGIDIGEENSKARKRTIIETQTGHRLVQTGITPLDAARSAAIKHLMSHGRTNTQSETSGDVVEIRGAAGTGKSHLVYEAVVNCILPAEVGGAEGEVLYFDLDLQLRCRRLFEIARFRLEDYVASAGQAAGRAIDIDTMLHAAMERVRVYRPQSSFHLLCTLHLVHEELARGSRTTPKLSVFDAVSAFYYQDLLTEPVNGGLHMSVPRAMKLLVAQGIAIIGTMPCDASSTSSVSREPKNSAWQNLVTLRVNLEKDDRSVHAKFSMGTSSTASTFAAASTSRPVGNPRALFAAYGCQSHSFNFTLDQSGINWTMKNR